MGRRTAGEDVVQETFLGFLTSLPNFEDSRPLESYLFSIAAHKLTDHLRREGRRPTLPMAGSSSSGSRVGAARPRPAPSRASCAAASAAGWKRRRSSRRLAEQIDRLRSRGEWQKLACLELLFVRGWANRDVAAQLKMSEQTVANFKFEFIARLRTLVRKQGLVAKTCFPNCTRATDLDASGIAADGQHRSPKPIWKPTSTRPCRSRPWPRVEQALRDDREAGRAAGRDQRPPRRRACTRWAKSGAGIG